MGFRWPSRQDSGLVSGEGVALYDRPDGPAPLKPSPDAPLTLDTPEGGDHLNGLLAPLRIRGEQPRTRRLT